MKNKELEKKFLENLELLSSYNDNDVYMNNEEVGWFLFGSEDFHLNIQRNTLYLKKFGILLDNVLNEELLQVEWVSMQQQKTDSKKAHFIIGAGNPFENLQMSVNIKGKQIVRAIPYSFLKKNQRLINKT